MADAKNKIIPYFNEIMYYGGFAVAKYENEIET